MIDLSLGLGLGFSLGLCIGAFSLFFATTVQIYRDKVKKISLTDKSIDVEFKLLRKKVDEIEDRLNSQQSL